MDLPALRYFIAVAEECHFRRAAVRIGITQPALSSRIQGLELELGARLFDRGPGAPVCLTPAGSELLPLAREIVDLARRAEGAVAQTERRERGALSVAAAAEIPGAALSHAVRRFRSIYPEVHLAVREMDASSQLAELDDGRVDVAVIRHVCPLPSSTVLDAAELGIASVRDDPGAAHRSVDPRELGDGRPILMPGTLAPDCEQAVFEHCQAHGFEPTDRYGATGPGLLLEVLSAISGRPAVALTPRPPEGIRPRLAWQPLDAAPLRVSTSVLTNRGRHRTATHDFVDALVTAYGQNRNPRSAALSDPESGPTRAGVAVGGR